MRNASRLRVLVAVTLAVATVALAPRPVIGQSLVFKSGVDLVPLTVTVTDRTGRYVQDLTAGDFAILEEGQRQVISHFASGHVPVDMAFLLDTSSSMRDTLRLAQHAARGLVRELREGDRGAVAAIGSTVSLHQSMTPDLARVDEALRSTHADGNTALYDALYVVLRQYQQELRDTGEIRRQVLVLLSDGLDTASHVSFDDVLDLVRRVQVTIDVVSLGEDPALLKRRVGRQAFEAAHALCVLAQESGGRLFTPRAARELPAIYQAIAAELSNQYVIGYLPGQATDGTFRRVSVGVLRPKAGIVRTRAGYYADARTGDRLLAGTQALLGR